MPTEQPVRKIFDTKAATNEWTERASLRIGNYMRRAAVLADDGRRARRLASQECKYCYYLRGDRIVGHSFTDYTCGICGSKLSWPNTGVLQLCEKCAKEHKLCRSCGADLELQQR